MRNEMLASLSDECRAKIRETFERFPEPTPTPMFFTLHEEEKQDVLHGRCIYREYEGTPILDYS